MTVFPGLILRNSFRPFFIAPNTPIKNCAGSCLHVTLSTIYSSIGTGRKANSHNFSIKHWASRLVTSFVVRRDIFHTKVFLAFCLSDFYVSQATFISMDSSCLSRHYVSFFCNFNVTDSLFLCLVSMRFSLWTCVIFCSRGFSLQSLYNIWF